MAKREGWRGAGRGAASLALMMMIDDDDLLLQKISSKKQELKRSSVILKTPKTPQKAEKAHHSFEMRTKLEQNRAVQHHKRE